MDWIMDWYFWLKVIVPTFTMIIIIGEVEKRRNKQSDSDIDFLYRCQYCGEHRGVEIKNVLSKRVIKLLPGFPAQQMILESAVIVCPNCPCRPHQSVRFAYKPAV